MAGPPAAVAFYLDPVSPYSWLALMQADSLAAAHGFTWEVRPVVYAKLLEAHGLQGPAESPVRRRYLFHDVERCAWRQGLPFAGPPAHPFRSLEALRVLCLFRREPQALALAASLSHAAWGEGRDLTHPAVLAGIVAAAGLDARDLPARSTAAAVKDDLRQLTAAAVAAGVFGVPTFGHGQALFWGHDRLSHLADHLAGRFPAGEHAEAALARPAGVVRRGQG